MVVFADQDRSGLRRVYVDAWRKFNARQPLEPLEAQIAAVISEHPEYIESLESEDVLSADFSPESGRVNPFLHMALHLALREQVATDRPHGIAKIHKRLSKRLGDVHEAEHTMLTELAEIIWETQRYGTTPDEAAYLERLKRL